MSQTLWEETLHTLESRVDPHQYRKWLATLSVLNEAENQLELIAPNTFVRDWVYENYLPLIREALAAHTQKAMQIKIQVPDNVESPSPAALRIPTRPESEEAKDFLSCPPGSRAGLRPNYTFKDFVVGAS